VVVGIQRRNPQRLFLSERSKITKRYIDRARGIKVKMAAIFLIFRPDSPGMRAIKIDPTTGRKSITVK
jgi:hypothetical protein